MSCKPCKFQDSNGECLYKINNEHCYKLAECALRFTVKLILFIGCIVLGTLIVLGIYI